MSALALGSRRDQDGTVIGITSGKGGVGKTAIAVNLAISLARRGLRVGLVDADFGLGKIDVMLGLTANAHLGDVLRGHREIEEIVLRGPAGVRVVPAGTGQRDLTALGADQWMRLATGLARFREDLDFLLIDTAAGISGNVVDLLSACERVLVVTSADPTALVDGYAVTKLVAHDAPDTELGVVVNQARSAEEGSLIFHQLERAARRFLGRGLSYYGAIPRDPALGSAVRAQEALVDRLPQAPASRSFRLLASRLAGLGPLPLDRQSTRPMLSLAYSSSHEVRPCA